MAAIPWTRLVRYTTSPNGPVKYGEPVLGEGERELSSTNKVTVRALEGENIWSLRKTEQTEVAHKLLGPLEPKDVPIIRCIGLNYKSHILEGGHALPESPTVFMKPSPSVADHDTDTPIPKLAQACADYEGELVIVIGKDGKDISKDDALDYVLGYTAGNDVSARDWQREKDKAGPVPQWGFSKSFDKYAPLGPMLVRTSELGAADMLTLQTWVNGELRQETNTSDLWHGVRSLVAFCSQGQTLQRGSLIMTGTPGGVGLFMKPPTYLRDGDEVKVRIEGIGTLRNTVKFE